MKTKLLFCIFFSFLTTISFAQETPATLQQLPEQARNFLKDNFKSPFHHAIKEVKGTTIIYDVYLNDETEIEFDETGRWVEIDGKTKSLPTKLIQKRIIDYVNLKYPKNSVVKMERQATQYEIGLSNDVDLIFDAMGSFVRID